MGEDAHMDGVVHGNTLGGEEPVEVDFHKFRGIFLHFLPIGSYGAAFIGHELPEQGNIHCLGFKTSGEGAVAGTHFQK